MIIKNVILLIAGCLFTALFFSFIYLGFKNLSEDRDIALVQCGLSFLIVVIISDCIKGLIGRDEMSKRHEYPYEAQQEIKDLGRQLEERNKAHIELHQDYNKKYNECKDLERQLEEAREDELSFLYMHIMAYIYPSSTCEIYASVCKRIKELKEKG